MPYGKKIPFSLIFVIDVNKLLSKNSKPVKPEEKQWNWSVSIGFDCTHIDFIRQAP